jgi:acetolactate synthase-1/2/3 large subunit
MPTVAETLADHLHAAGVRFAFGMPGGETVEVLDALRRQGIRFELVHDEASAVFMADAVARITGKPAVALTTLGPGATNATPGVAHAYLDRAPVIFITAQKPDALLPDYTHQVLDLHAIFAPITKRTIKVTAQNVATEIPQILALATDGRPGPIHLQISNEEAALGIGDRGSGTGDWGSSRRSPITKWALCAIPDPRSPIPNPLLSARRPVIITGVGLEPEGPYDALRELAEAANAPVIVTPKAKGALPDDHPLSAGTIGLTRTDPVYEILDEADCVVAVGFDVVELVKEWQHPAPLIWIAPWANEDPVLPAAVEWVGPMTPILRQLSDAEFNTDPAWGEARVAAFRAKLAARPLPIPADGRLLPQTVLETMRRHADRNTLLAVDVGSHKIFSSLEWPTLSPNRFLVSNGLSCMGFALPSALGASLALDGAPTLCLIGDGGLAMCLGELGVLARLGLPVTVVVLVDGAIDLIRSAQIRSRRPVHGTEFPPPDFSRIAEAYGIHAVRVCDEASCDAALQQALASGRPALIEVMLDPVGYPTTPKGNPSSSS